MPLLVGALSNELVVVPAVLAELCAQALVELSLFVGEVGGWILFAHSQAVERGPGGALGGMAGVEDGIPQLIARLLRKRNQGRYWIATLTPSLRCLVTSPRTSSNMPSSSESVAIVRRGTLTMTVSG